MTRFLSSQLQERFAVGWYRLIASDPGLTRLSMASRAIATVVLALGLLEALATLVKLPLPAIMLGAVVALMSSMMVNDASRRERRITTLLLPLPAAAAISLGAFLAPYPIAGDVAFVVIVFAAVYVRRFGPRGFALGMISFITYFISLFLHVTLALWPRLMLAVALGTGCAYAMRFLIFPNRPERRIRAMLRACYARTANMIDAVADAIKQDGPSSSTRRVVRRRVVQLNETVLMVEGELDTLTEADPPDRERKISPVRALFDLELAVERVAGATRTPLATPERNTALDDLRELRRLAVDRRRVTGASGTTMALAEPAIWALALRDLRSALAQAPDLGDVRRILPAPTDPKPRTEDTTTDQARPSSDQPAKLRPTTRQAIQVATAAALAIIGGELLSPQRWYWAAITAFVVFAGTSSRGETLSKGWQRVMGTGAGVVAGVGVALVVNGHTYLSVGLIFACFFLAFYFIQISYGLMIFWITIALALLYGLIGLFSVHLLELRLEETLLGAIIGVFVASVVLPTRTTATVRDASHAYLGTLSQLVTACAQALGGGEHGHELTHTARNLDRDFQQLRTVAKPLSRGIAGAFGRRGIRRWLRALLGCRYYARHLARLVDQHSLVAHDSELAAACTETAAHINANIRALRAAHDESAHNAETAVGTSAAFDRAATALQHASPDMRTATRYLQRIDRLVVDLAHNFGPGRK